MVAAARHEPAVDEPVAYHDRLDIGVHIVTLRAHVAASSEQSTATPEGPRPRVALAARGASPASHRDGGCARAAKARRVKIPSVFERAATPAGGMQRPSNAAGVAPRAARSQTRAPPF